MRRTEHFIANGSLGIVADANLTYNQGRACIARRANDRGSSWTILLYDDSRHRRHRRCRIRRGARFARPRIDLQSAELVAMLTDIFHAIVLTSRRYGRECSPGEAAVNVS